MAKNGNGVARDDEKPCSEDNMISSQMHEPVQSIDLTGQSPRRRPMDLGRSLIPCDISSDERLVDSSESVVPEQDSGHQTFEGDSQGNELYSSESSLAGARSDPTHVRFTPDSAIDDGLYSSEASFAGARGDLAQSRSEVTPDSAIGDELSELSLVGGSDGSKQNRTDSAFDVTSPSEAKPDGLDDEVLVLTQHYFDGEDGNIGASGVATSTPRRGARPTPIAMSILSNSPIVALPIGLADRSLYNSAADSVPDGNTCISNSATDILPDSLADGFRSISATDTSPDGSLSNSAAESVPDDLADGSLSKSATNTQLDGLTDGSLSNSATDSVPDDLANGSSTNSATDTPPDGLTVTDGSLSNSATDSVPDDLANGSSTKSATDTPPDGLTVTDGRLSNSAVDTQPDGSLSNSAADPKPDDLAVGSLSNSATDSPPDGLADGSLSSSQADTPQDGPTDGSLSTSATDNLPDGLADGSLPNSATHTPPDGTLSNSAADNLADGSLSNSTADTLPDGLAGGSRSNSAANSLPDDLADGSLSNSAANTRSVNTLPDGLADGSLSNSAPDNLPDGLENISLNEEDMQEQEEATNTSIAHQSDEINYEEIIDEIRNRDGLEFCVHQEEQRRSQEDLEAANSSIAHPSDEIDFEEAIDEIRNRDGLEFCVHQEEQRRSQEDLLTRIDDALEGKSPMLPLETAQIATASAVYQTPILTNQGTLDQRRLRYLATLQQVLFQTTRDMIFINLVKSYNFPDFITKRLYVQYFDQSKDNNHPFEEGIDLHGMTRDLFSNFWRDDRSRAAFAEDIPLTSVYGQCKCPNKCQCRLFATIAYHGYLLTRQIPIWLQGHRFTVMGMFCSRDQVTEEFGKELAKYFIADQCPFVKSALERCLRDGIDANDARDVFESLPDHFRRPMRSLPQKDPKAFQEWLEASVLDACVYSPNHFVTIFRDLLEQANLLGHSTPTDAIRMYKTLEITSESVAVCLSVRNDLKDKLSLDEERAFSFIKAFPYTCERSELEDFLMFCTGNITLTESTIKVDFYQGKGYPKSHTCFNALHIPTGCEKEEFNANMKFALRNKFNLKFTKV